MALCFCVVVSVFGATTTFKMAMNFADALVLA